MFLFSLKHWKTKNTFKRFYSELAGGLQVKLPRAPKKFTSQTTKNYYAKTSATYPMTLNFQTYLKKLLKRFYLASIPIKP